MTITPTLEWICEHCQKPIDDGQGVFWTSITAADAFKAHMDSLRGRDDTTVADILNGPSPAAWQLTHHQCRDTIDSRVYSDAGAIYGVPVEEMRSPARLLWWAGHLFEKSWSRSTNLADVLQEWGSR